jgi:3-oxoacyl-[acyl-carrier-protein] synthase II
MHPVRVSGLGLVSAFGTSLDTFADSLLSGRTAIARISSFDTASCRSTLAAEIPAFDSAAWVPPMKSRRMDRTGVYALAASALTLRDAGVKLPPEGSDDAGIVLGTWTAGGQSTHQFLDALFRQGPLGAPAMLFDSTVGNSAASVVALDLKLRGPNVTVSHKEASGLAAMVCAVDHLREGRARALLAGGVDALYETFFKGHDRFHVMSRQTVFSEACAPFDEQRAGFVVGEGAFLFWLDRDDSPGHGQVLGVSASSAAVPVNQWPQHGDALIRTMRLAIEDAELDASDIDVVYASANASPGLDDVEATAIGEIFGASRPVVTSIKGALGESGASGAAACLAALVCGRRRQVPPISGLIKPAAAAKGLRLAQDAVDLPGPIALINSVGSGGALFSVVLRIRTD